MKSDKSYILCNEQKKLLKKYTTLWTIHRYNIKKNTIFVNSGNSKTLDLHKPLVHLTDKINLRRKDKYIPLSNLSIYDI